MKRLAQVTMVMASAPAVNIVLGFARSKYGAVALGPSGVGLFAQANSFLLLATTVCTLGMSTGMVKSFAEVIGQGDEEERNRRLESCWLLFLMTGAGALALLLCSLPWSARLLMGDANLAMPLLGVAVAIPCAVLAVFFECVQMGAGRYDLYTRASLIGFVVNFLAFLVMTYLWGVRGAIVSVGVGSLLRLMMFVYYGRVALPWSPRIFGRISFSVIRSLVGFAAAMFVIATIQEASNLAIRTMILDRLGAAANGIYQVPLAMSSYSSIFFTNVLWGHYYPKHCQQISHEERTTELNGAVRFVALGMTVMCAGIIVSRHILVTVFYSSKFEAAAPLLACYTIGDLFYVVALVFSISCLSLSRLRVYVAVGIVFSLLRTLLAGVLIGRFGLMGPAVAYTLSSVVMVAIYLADHQWSLRLNVARGNVLLLIAAPVILALQFLLPWSIAMRLLAQFVLAAICLPFVFTSAERKTIMARVLHRLGLKKKTEEASVQELALADRCS